MSRQVRPFGISQGGVSATADTIVALGTLAKPFLGDGHRFSTLLNASTLDVSGISERWAATLERLTGDSRLPILRALNGGALVLTVAVYSWDSIRAFRQGDRDSGVAYGIAAAGGVIAIMGAMTFFALPIALVVLGWSLLIGGAAVGAWLADSPLVTLLNNGPFGRIQSPGSQFDYLQDEQVAYNQLVGIFGAPRLKAWRLSDWLLQATAEQQEMLEAIHQEEHRTYNEFEHRNRTSCMPLDREDWVVTVASPLLAMCSSTRGLQLKVEERLTRHTYSLDGIADTGVEQRETLTRAKAVAFPVDPTTLMWVLPPQFPASAITPAQRNKAYYTHGLTLRLQMYLGGIEACEPNSLVLPQPTPTYWRPFVPDDMNPPKNRANATNVPYWLIHDETFRK